MSQKLINKMGFDKHDDSFHLIEVMNDWLQEPMHNDKLKLEDILEVQTTMEGQTGQHLVTEE